MPHQLQLLAAPLQRSLPAQPAVQTDGHVQGLRCMPKCSPYVQQLALHLGHSQGASSNKLNDPSH